MDLGAAFVADEQSFHPVEPGEGTFDDPAVAAQAGAVLGFAACDDRFDPAEHELIAVGVGVVAAVRDHGVGSAAGMSDEASDRGYAVEQRQQLRDVVAVAAGQRPRQRQTIAVYEEVVLGARTAPIDRARARL